VLRPIVGNAYQALGPMHPRLGDVVRALRLGHLRLMSRLAAPGGRVELLTDVASSATIPDLASRPESTLHSLLDGPKSLLLQGVAPAVVRESVREDRELAARLIPDRRSAVWRWNLHDRTYLVWGWGASVAP
jgi:hypothetical protein